jgi:hypothetical protein
LFCFDVCGNGIVEVCCLSYESIGLDELFFMHFGMGFTRVPYPVHSYESLIV